MPRPFQSPISVTDEAKTTMTRAGSSDIRANRILSPRKPKGLNSMQALQEQLWSSTKEAHVDSVPSMTASDGSSSNVVVVSLDGMESWHDRRHHHHRTRDDAATSSSSLDNDNSSVSLDDLNDAVSSLRTSSMAQSSHHKSVLSGSSMPRLESFCQGSFASSSRTSLELSVNLDDTSIRELGHNKAGIFTSHENSISFKTSFEVSSGVNELQPVIGARPRGGRDQETRWGKDDKGKRDSMPSLPSFR